MRNLKKKFVLIILIFVINILLTATVFGANENIQILEKSEKEYMIYLKNNMYKQFEFAISNNPDANEKELNYQNAAKDIEESNINYYIAYIDKEVYERFSDSPMYLWARTLSGSYFAKGVEIDLSQTIKEEDIREINSVTKRININSDKSVTTEEIQEEVEITKTVGKIEILEEGTTYYQLIELPSSEAHNKLMQLAKQITNNIENNMYERLEVAGEFIKLYKELEPGIDSTDWIIAENNETLQPEDSKQDEEYILWLKTEDDENTEIDVQFLTCFEDYEPKYISEKLVSVLPITYDNPILIISLAILIVAFVIVFILKKLNLKGKDKREE